MGADSPAQNTPNASQNFRPKCLPKPKSSRFLKKSSLWVSVVRETHNTLYFLPAPTTQQFGNCLPVKKQIAFQNRCALLKEAKNVFVQCGEFLLFSSIPPLLLVSALLWLHSHCSKVKMNGKKLNKFQFHFPGLLGTLPMSKQKTFFFYSWTLEIPFIRFGKHTDRAYIFS